MNNYIAILLLAFSGTAFAGNSTFECHVISVHVISNNGNIIQDTEHLKKQIGSTFSVERSTGEIRGGYFINNRSVESIEVINEPLNNSYYVISKSFGPYRTIGYLYIANHRKWSQKPFTYTSAGEYIYSGYCV